MGNICGRESHKDSSPIGTEKVSITYTTLDAPSPVTEHFDYLVVACDPRTLPFASRTALEQQVSDALHSFTFRTSLFKARRPRHPELPSDGDDQARREDVPNYAVRFNPAPLARKDGQVYGFRDEVMARDADLSPSANNITWLTMYQLDGSGLLLRDEQAVRAELDGKRDAVLADRGESSKWLNFSLESDTPHDSALVDYFPHFESNDLAALLPWKIRDAQGEKNTLYVSSFTCFESVLHCYLYADELMDPSGPVVQRSFPTDKNARIAVIGAGPSGVMFSCLHLARKGYTNFKVFEKSARFGGKTITVRKSSPADPAVSVPCELGTCYLSLGYEPMYWLFDEYEAGEVESLDKGSKVFRSIVDSRLARNEEEQENGISFNEWTVRKNGPYETLERIQFFVAAVKFIAVHYATMGMTMEDCMPAVPPSEATIIGNLHRVFVDSVRNLLFGVGEGNAGNFDNGGATQPRQNMQDAEETEQDSFFNNELQRRGGRVPVNALFGVLNSRNEGRVGSGVKKRSGLFGKMREMRDTFNDVTDEVSEEELKAACRDVFHTSFAAFLDRHGMGDLKATFVYAYQVQGYGTIETIPTYYGLIWITPAVLLGTVRKLFSDNEEVRELGTVNIMSRGWLALWEKMVAAHLTNRITFNVNITRIHRQ